MARLQLSWGKRYRNPWAERKAAEPKTTPAFIWKLLGAIDPILGADGCVWTDPLPKKPSTRWFCIGKPASDDPAQIVLPDGRRIPADTHLWELGHTLRLDDGDKVVDIPLVARFRRAVGDYIEQKQRERAENRDKYHREICEGKVSILNGADPGTAAMLANDDFGGRAALMGEELLRQAECNPSSTAEDQALMALNLLGAARSRGPLRARPPNTARLSEAGEGELPARRAGSGVSADNVAEHTNPPRLGPPVLSDKVRTHVFTGNLSKEGEAKGWHYEKGGDAKKGTYVLEPTRSAPDAHGVYEANVIIEGVKKKARSSFFPAHWTPEEVEKTILNAYANKQPVPGKPPGWFRATTPRGIKVELEVSNNGTIRTAYPLMQRAERP